MSHDRFTQSDRALGDPLANIDISGGVNENLFADAYHGGPPPFERSKACGPVLPGSQQPDMFSEGGFRNSGAPGDPYLAASRSHFGPGPDNTDSTQFDPMRFGAPSRQDGPDLIRAGEWSGHPESAQLRSGQQQQEFMPPPDFRSDNTMPPGMRRNSANGADGGEAPEFGPLSLLSGDNALTDDQKTQLRALRDDHSTSNINSSDLRQDQQKLQALLTSTDLNAQDIKDMQSTINTDLSDQNNSRIEQQIKVAEILTPEQRTELSRKFDRSNDQI